MIPSSRCLELIKESEGVAFAAYPDTGGVWTIGVGHICGVKKGDVATVEQIDKWLEEDLATAADAVNKTVHKPLNQNQFDALVSFVFNVGVNAFHQSTMLSRLNEGDYASASAQFPRWVYDNGITVPGLRNRRLRERALFDTP